MDFVLVHGTTQSPAAWDRLSTLLVDRGHRAVAVDLPVDQPDLLADDYARVAAEQVADDVREPVVVAHSGGGLVLPALARRLSARHLVWLGALIPDFTGGRSLLEQIQTEQDEMFGHEWPEWTGDDDAEAVYFLFHSADLRTMRWALTTLRPWRPRAAYGEPAPERPTAPSTYVLPRDDRTLTPTWMRTAARERLGVEAVEIDGDHCPHVNNPALVAAILCGLG
ncbi:MAG TPA: alpha/beta hydrolase [Pseudonocardiaceae bacterium]|nr:alpha/beta hydrolase [Pseudonocardiaceae bacterium]